MAFIPVIAQAMQLKDVDDELLKTIESEIKMLKKKNKELYGQLMNRNNNLASLGHRADSLRFKSENLYKNTHVLKKRTLMVAGYTVLLVLLFLVMFYVLLKR